MPRTDQGSADSQGETAPRLTASVLARLPEADHQRAALRRRQVRQRLCIATLAAIGLGICLGPFSASAVSQTLAWVLAADTAWNALARVLLGGLAFLPPLSAAFMCFGALLLWRCLAQPSRPAQTRATRADDGE